eukprot:2814670-Rhodomonas_salina.1
MAASAWFQVSREDYHLYMIFSYLTLIRLEDISIPVFRKFVFSQDAQKMFVWLTFIFNAQVLLDACSLLLSLALSFPVMCSLLGGFFCWHASVFGVCCDALLLCLL